MPSDPIPPFQIRELPSKPEAASSPWTGLAGVLCWIPLTVLSGFLPFQPLFLPSAGVGLLAGLIAYNAVRIERRMLVPAFGILLIQATAFAIAVLFGQPAVIVDAVILTIAAFFLLGAPNLWSVGLIVVFEVVTLGINLLAMSALASGNVPPGVRVAAAMHVLWVMILLRCCALCASIGGYWLYCLQGGDGGPPAEDSDAIYPWSKVPQYPAERPPAPTLPALSLPVAARPAVEATVVDAPTSVLPRPAPAAFPLLKVVVPPPRPPAPEPTIETFPVVPPQPRRADEAQPAAAGSVQVWVLWGSAGAGVLAIAVIAFFVGRNWSATPATPATPPAEIADDPAALAAAAKLPPPPFAHRAYPLLISRPLDLAPLRPATFPDTEHVSLGELCREIRVGGGGQYLVCRLTNDKLAIVDLGTGRGTGSIPCHRADCYAADASGVVVVAPDGRALRARLSDGEIVHRGQLSLGGKAVLAVGMGHRSAGPLLLVLGGTWRGAQPVQHEVLALDPQTFAIKGRDVLRGMLDSVRIEASSDGDSFAILGRHSQLAEWRGGHEPPLEQIEINRGWFQYAEGNETGSSPDGYCWRSTALSLGWNSTGREFDKVRLPAIGNSTFGVVLHAPPDLTKQQATLLPVLFSNLGFGIDPPLTTDLWTDEHGGEIEDRPPITQRVFMIPDLEVIAEYDLVYGHLYLHRMDVRGRLARIREEYLAIVSTPPASVAAGETFHYRPLASVYPEQPFRFEFQTGGQWQRVPPTGFVWEVPADEPPRRIFVKLRAVSRTAGTVEQDFTFAVTRASAAAP